MGSEGLRASIALAVDVKWGEHEAVVGGGPEDLLVSIVLVEAVDWGKHVGAETVAVVGVAASFSVEVDVVAVFVLVEELEFLVAVVIAIMGVLVMEVL